MKNTTIIYNGKKIARVSNMRLDLACAIFSQASEEYFSRITFIENYITEDEPRNKYKIYYLCSKHKYIAVKDYGKRYKGNGIYTTKFSAQDDRDTRFELTSKNHDGTYSILLNEEWVIARTKKYKSNRRTGYNPSSGRYVNYYYAKRAANGKPIKKVGNEYEVIENA